MAEHTVHFLVPRHQILTEEEKKKFFETTGLTPAQLPKINSTDAEVKQLELKMGDVVCVFRKGDADPSVELVNYRVVPK